MSSRIAGNARRVAPALALIVLAAPAAAAPPELAWNGQVRVRTTVQDRSFAMDAPIQSFTELRSRLALQATVQDNVTALLQFQDSRVLGGTGATGEPTSATLNDGHNVDLHQAFVRIDRLAGDAIGLRAGRFELNLGNQRLFGSVGWHNVGRSWEGITVETRADGWRTDLHWLKRLELNDPVMNRDFDVLGLHVKSPFGVEGFGFLEQDADESLGPAPPFGIDNLNRWTIGAYGKRKEASFDLEANLALQGGNRRAGTGASAVQQDIAASLFALEVGVPLRTARPARIAAAVDYASGDATPGSGKYRAFDNLYYTGHKFRGYMDYFLASGPAGLVDWIARGRLEPADGWTVAADWHLFRTAVEQPALGGGTTKEVGQEIDVVLGTTRVEGVALEAVLGAFLPGDTFAGSTSSETAWFAAFSLTTNFASGS